MPRSQTNPEFLLLSVLTSTCLFVISVLLYASGERLLVHPEPSQYSNVSLVLENVPSVNDEDIQRDLTALSSSLQLGESLRMIPPSPQSMTAILPITPSSLLEAQYLLAPFLEFQEHIREVIIVCPAGIASDVRRILQQIFSSLEFANHPDVSLQPWQRHSEVSSNTLRVAATVATDWVLIMDDKAFTGLRQSAQSALLHPFNMTIPFGFSGEPLSPKSPDVSFHWGRGKPARYLRPPFVLQSFVATSINDHTLDGDSWIDIGRRIAEARIDGLGGLIFSADTEASKTLLPSNGQATLVEIAASDLASITNTSNELLPVRTLPPTFEEHTLQDSFVFFLPTRADLRRLIPMICKMQMDMSHIRILVYHDVSERPGHFHWKSEVLETYQCTVAYDVLSGRDPLCFSVSGCKVLSEWLRTSRPVNVIFTLYEIDPLVNFFMTERNFQDASLIRIPRSDLENTEWMASLSLEEWKNWHLPRVDITIITNIRPQSLIRLLKSLSKALYFGDEPNLRITIEQDCDAETLKVAQNLNWTFGHVFLHHRVVHGGLLPAVVESWYPHNNDSYGLLLEDDTEVSPLFYAWIKMTVLRYRYGKENNRTPHMFGVSLYQQKNLELPPEGRRAFNPRTLFSEVGLHFPTTPYLSQVPCSWGAVYFPEHWREFHDYLAVRLGETSLKLKTKVVPDVRSNRWSKSWKKFFIELVYLRGYVMLYPNYEDFVSLSTNHLEVGSHVKQRSREKQELFLLPLMKLDEPLGSSSLLDLPDHTLPSLEMLPVLNLTGSITSLGALIEQGNRRRNELMHCDFSSELYSINTLMCMSSAPNGTA